MISLRNVNIDMGGRVMFRDINCDFPGGSITTIRKTGVLDGSSTLLKCCSGIMQPSSGEVLWKGENVNGLSGRDRYRRLSYCYESGGLVSLFSIYNNIALPLVYHNIYPEDEIQERIYQVCSQLNIDHLLELEPYQLNDVQIRLANLARAFILKAEAIFVDELQTGMSQDIYDNVVEVLQEQARCDRVIVMVTTSGHDDSFAGLKLQISNQALEVLQ